MHLSPQMPKLGTYAEVAAGIVEDSKLADWHRKLHTHRKIKEGFSGFPSPPPRHRPHDMVPQALRGGPKWSMRVLHAEEGEPIWGL